MASQPDREKRHQLPPERGLTREDDDGDSGGSGRSETLTQLDIAGRAVFINVRVGLMIDTIVE